jgi:citrate synthase
MLKTPNDNSISNMDSDSASAQVKSRGDKFSVQLETKITNEIPPKHNPYHAKQQIIYGYDHLDLLENCDYLDVNFLLMRGKLPSPTEKILFNKLAIALINPGPRHPATQASMTAGVGKTAPVNILPIALGVYGGNFDGAGKIETMMRWLRKSHKRPINEYLEASIKGEIDGIEQYYGDADTYCQILINALKPVAEQGKIFSWLYELNQQLIENNIGISKAMLTAAILADLGFQPRHGASIMQLLAAPGLLAHGLELSNKPLTAMLFESDDVYTIEEHNND